ncbi:hypothetical protein EDB84DRAFT_1508075 [Lactarius hengduanensis]|nr:hypothetical protein EDB84DRAFT_1508075 [Lactarius hengduanensis]
MRVTRTPRKPITRSQPMKCRLANIRGIRPIRRIAWARSLGQIQWVTAWRGKDATKTHQSYTTQNARYSRGSPVFSDTEGEAAHPTETLGDDHFPSGQLSYLPARDRRRILTSRGGTNWGRDSPSIPHRLVDLSNVTSNIHCTQDAGPREHHGKIDKIELLTRWELRVTSSSRVYSPLQLKMSDNVHNIWAIARRRRDRWP